MIGETVHPPAAVTDPPGCPPGHGRRRLPGEQGDRAPDPPQLVLGFGNTSQRAVGAGIAVLGDILAPLR